MKNWFWRFIIPSLFDGTKYVLKTNRGFAVGIKKNSFNFIHEKQLKRINKKQMKCQKTRKASA